MRTTSSAAASKTSATKAARTRKTAGNVQAGKAASSTAAVKAGGRKTKPKDAAVELSYAERIVKWLDDAKAEDIVSIDVRGKSSLADHMIVASGRSDRHVGAIADHVAKELKQGGYPIYSVEGQPQCDWVVVDAGDVIVHIFRPDVRDFYNLEKMWLADRPAENATH